MENEGGSEIKLLERYIIYGYKELTSNSFKLHRIEGKERYIAYGSSNLHLIDLNSIRYKELTPNRFKLHQMRGTYS